MDTTSVSTSLKNPTQASSHASASTMVEHDLTLKVRPWRRGVTPWADILAHEYKGAGTDADPHVVTWLPVDPENPQTYDQVYKWTVTMLGASNFGGGPCAALGGLMKRLELTPAAAGTLAVGFGSSMLSAAITNLMHAFPDHNKMLYIMSASMFGAPFGPS